MGKRTVDRELELARTRILTREDNARSCRGVVYLITNSLTKDRYVGATSAGLAVRWHYHKRDAFVHKKKSRLHTDMRKYGSNCFEVECIATCADLSQLAELEEETIARLKPEYNVITKPEDIWSGGFLMKLLSSDKAIGASILLAAAFLWAAPTYAYPPDYPSVLQYGIAPVTSAAAESSHVFCTTQCSVWSLVVTSGAAAGYVLTFNSTSAPVDGAVTPIDCIALPANATVSISYEPGPSDYMTTGYTAVFSTTGCFTKTASATALFKARVTR